MDQQMPVINPKAVSIEMPAVWCAKDCCSTVCCNSFQSDGSDWGGTSSLLISFDMEERSDRQTVL